MIEGVLSGILNKFPTSDESNDSIQAPASKLGPWLASSTQDSEGKPSYPQGALSESFMSVADVGTTAAAPELEAKNAPEDRPLSDVPDSESAHAIPDSESHGVPDSESHAIPDSESHAVPDSKSHDIPDLESAHAIPDSESHDILLVTQIPYSVRTCTSSRKRKKWVFFTAKTYRPYT